MSNIIKTPKIKPALLNLLNPQCAGIDVGAAELFVCIAKDSSTQEVRSFSTFTADLRQMIDWLKNNGIKSVAMESTGVYWIVPYEMLEDAGFEVLLVNSYFFKSAPGRKTDVADCQWIQQLHSYGLLRGSFRPSHEIVEMRSYVRLRTRLFESAATQVQLMHKALIQMNIQLNHAISDITGVTGLNIIQAILNGERSAAKLAALSVGGCRKNLGTIKKALEGNFRKEHLFALKQAYQAYEFFHGQIHVCEEEIQKLLSSIAIASPQPLPITVPSLKKRTNKTKSNRSPYSFDAPTAIKKITIADLTSIPGINANLAVKIISEIGTDMSRWANAKAFASWLGLCPGNKVSGGKVLSSKTKPSNNRAAQALRMAAVSLYRSKTALGAFFRRVRSRSGALKAITATGHKLSRILYRMMVNRENYRETGENFYEQQYRARVIANLSKRANELGYTLVGTN